MPSGYQPLSQSADEEADVGGSISQRPPSSRAARGLRRSHRPGPIDLSKLDNAFKRQALWIDNMFSTSQQCFQMDRINCTESETEEESTGPFTQANLA